MSAENRISCQVCLDLIPLVRDDVASEDSRALVLAHAEDCESCRAALTASGEPASESEPEKLPADDRRILQRLRRSLLTLGLALLGAGLLAGIFFTNSQNVFYNLLIMPAAGALGLLTLKRWWWLLPPGVFAVSYVPLLLSFMGEGYPGIGVLLQAPLFYSIIYAGLTLPGIAAAALLRFAFKKGASK